MTAFTPLGIPYPEADDRVADGNEQMQALAEATDALIDAANDARAVLEAALDARLDALELDSGWIAPGLGTGWANFGSGWASAGYRKVRGVTYLRGLVKRTTNPTSDTVFTLPAGYRPAQQGVFLGGAAVLYGVPGKYDDGSPFDNVLTNISNVGVRIDIFATGGVALNNVYVDSGALGDGTITWLSLNGISFPAEA